MAEIKSIMINEDAAKEYQQFISYFYFDWNIFSYLTSIFEHEKRATSQSQTANCLFHLMEKIVDKQKICFPYSEMHFRDFINVPDEYIANKINILQYISKGWKISEDKINNEYLRVDKCFDLHSDFYESKENNKFVNTIQDMTFQLLKKEPTMQSYLQNNSITSWDGFMKQSFTMLNDERIVKQPLAMECAANMTGNEIINEINVRLSASIFPFKSIDDFVLCQKSLYPNRKISDYSFMANLYSLLFDIVGFTNEKQKADSFPMNVINDLCHLGFALRCHGFVSEDRQLLTKAILCKKLMNSSVNIYTFNNFIKFILKTWLNSGYLKDYQVGKTANFSFAFSENEKRDFTVDPHKQYFF